MLADLPEPGLLTPAVSIRADLAGDCGAMWRTGYRSTPVRCRMTYQRYAVNATKYI